MSWPVTLPSKPLEDGYKETTQDGTLKIETDWGPGKTRQRFTALSSYIQCEYRLNYTQKTALDTFYKVTKKGGTLSFNWTHPSDGVKTVRFTSPPSYSGEDGYMYATINLEVLP